MIALGEFVLGIFLLALSGLALTSKVSYWKPKDSVRFVRILKCIGIVCVSLSFAVCTIITMEIKGNSPWSHLSPIWNKLIWSYLRIDKLAIQIPPPPKSPDLAYKEREAFRKAIPRIPEENGSQRVYDLSESRRTKLKRLLVQKEPRATLRIGCVYWSEDACVTAGEFLFVFSEAGWTIDSDKVFRVESPIPEAGVAIVSRPEPGTENLPPQPPHLGRWRKMTPSETTLWIALRNLDIPVHSSTESDLPEGTIGVYFGPQPQHPSPMQPSEKDAIQNVLRFRK